MPTDYNYNFAELQVLWVEANGGTAAADVAAAIAIAESGGCQYALAGPVDIRPVQACTWHQTDGENSCGLWQVNLRAHPNYSAPGIFDAAANAAAAVAISNGGQDFGAWTTYTSGAYLGPLRAHGGETTVTPPPAPAEPTGVPLSSMSGWHALSTTLARGIPADLTAARDASAATLRLLQKRSRIG